MRAGLLLTAGVALVGLAACSRGEDKSAPPAAQYNSQTGVVKGAAGLEANGLSAAGECLSAEDQRRQPSDFTPERRRQIVSCINAQLAQQVNPQLPRQIDPATRLDRLSTNGPELIYHYTVMRPASQLPANAGEQLERSTRTSVCGQPAMRQTLQMGGIYGYRWVDNRGQPIHQLSISAC
jgi:hypothetical protein